MIKPLFQRDVIFEPSHIKNLDTVNSECTDFVAAVSNLNATDPVEQFLKLDSDNVITKADFKPAKGEIGKKPVVFILTESEVSELTNVRPVKRRNLIIEALNKSVRSHYGSSLRFFNLPMNTTEKFIMSLGAVPITYPPSISDVSDLTQVGYRSDSLKLVKNTNFDFKNRRTAIKNFAALFVFSELLSLATLDGSSYYSVDYLNSSSSDSSDEDKCIKKPTGSLKIAGSDLA
jgi:hypothetical protein